VDKQGYKSGNSTTLLDLLERMAFMRAFEEACAEGVRTGELRGEIHIAAGQEGIAAGVELVVESDDWIVGTHRSHPLGLAKGVDPYRMLAEIFEKSTGLCRGFGGHLHLFDPVKRFSVTGIVGSSISIAAGHAYATALTGSGGAAIAVTGDGGVNTGQFHEVLNMAALWRLPLVILVEDNGYGISVARSVSTAGEGAIARAAAFGIDGFAVEGADPIAVAEVMGSCLRNARAGLGPSVVVASCVRIAGHYEGDPHHYRSTEEKLRAATKDDPIVRFVERMRCDGVPEVDIEARSTRAKGAVAEILTTVRLDPAPNPNDALRYVFAETF